MAEYQEDQLLDCKGMQCPLPIVKTKKMIDSMEVDQILKMVATDPGAINDMAAWSRRTGHELLESITADNEFIFYVRKVA
ncbi:MAG: sulfurtransferase TusA family protein [Candidatus Marinimicrobia bacterium]|nr:sulfurtransferase TusA family protein [Candidatus Neomarinimicrobiota bacterium]